MDLSILKEIGLTDNEILLYQTLLASGPSLASKIAEKSGLYRPYVYDTLERLLEKGLVHYSIGEGKKLFSAAEPERLQTYLEERIEELDVKKERLDSLIKELKGMAPRLEGEVRVEVHKGAEGLKFVLKDCTRFMEEQNKIPEAEREFLIYGLDDKTLVGYARLHLKVYFERLVQKNFKERLLIKEGETYFIGNEKSYYRAMPKEYFTYLPFQVYGNKVFLEIFEPHPFVIMIESEQIADAYKKQFNFMWKHAKKINWKAMRTEI